MSTGTGHAAVRAIEVIGTVVLVVMTLHIVGNAVARTGWDAPLSSTTEIVSYWYMPGIAFVGMVVAAAERSHTEANVLYVRFPRRVRREVHVLGQLLAAAVCGTLTWFGGQEAMYNRDIGLTGGVTGLVIWPTTFLAPVCFGVMTVLFVVAALSPADPAEHGAPEASA